MACLESTRLPEYFDGEVDSAAALLLERHLQTCAECQGQLAALQEVRGLLRGPARRLIVPAALRGRITDALDQEPTRPARGRRAEPSRPFWFGVLSGIGGSAVAAALGFVFLLPLLTNPLPAELVADHTHSLLSSHLIDVVSTDQHTVKPWFAGRTDVSPEVADFAAQGYRLLGGRVEVLDQQRAAVLVYQHGAHFINVYTWAAGSGGVPQDTTRRGYHLAFWKQGDLQYCAVSDAGWTELKVLAGLIQGQAARDQPH
ncbi:MAG TPA: zf-HC2 domain-containing protein [Steroidobacteraceae bacterium]|jgi:anti-sigma factor RsiW|nr:zf-HC2 domain-containing protein [Steroidobacteraceae bacterium]